VISDVVRNANEPPMKKGLVLKDVEEREHKQAVEAVNRTVEKTLSSIKKEKKTKTNKKWPPSAEDIEVLKSSPYAMRALLDEAVESEDLNVLRWFVDNSGPSVSCHLSGLVRCLVKHKQTEDLQRLVARGISLPTEEVSLLVRYYTESEELCNGPTLRELLDTSFNKTFREEMVASLPLENTKILLNYLTALVSGDTIDSKTLAMALSWLSTTVNTHFSVFVLHTETHASIAALKHTASALLKQQEGTQTLFGQVESVTKKMRMPKGAGQPYTISSFHLDSALTVQEIKAERFATE